MLTIQNGGTVSDLASAIGNGIGSHGALIVTDAGSIWTNIGTIQVGGLGTGTVTIQNGATLNSGGGGSIGLSAGSVGTVIVTGAGSLWNNSPGGGLNIGAFGAGTLEIMNGGTVNNNTGFAANIGQAVGSLGTVIVSGAGSSWTNSSGLNVANSGMGTLTIADGGIVRVSGPFAIANNAGSIGALNIGAPASGPAAAPGTLATASVGFGAGAGIVNFNHTSGNYVFAPVIGGSGTVNVLSGTTIVTAPNTYSGATNVIGGVLKAGALNTFSPNSTVRLGSGGTLDLNGFNQTVLNLTNAGLVNMGSGMAPGTILMMNSYTGIGGTIAMNTFLGADGSPSDKLVINGGSAIGNSFLRISNAGGPGIETVANGILVVQTINGGTTVPGAFALAGEVRDGALDFGLFRGGLDGSSPNDWFLRSTFVVGPIPPELIIPPAPILPPDPPPQTLPPGFWPIIGPELATYGVVQPIARQMGLTTLGTFHERVGDASAEAACLSTAPYDGAITKARPVPYGDCHQAVWGRLFGQQIDNHYQAFADPRTSGQVAGIQTGIDVWRGSLIPGHRDTAGLYFAYGNGNVSVDGLVTNPAATAYIVQHTGSLNLNAYSVGGYWTHYGPAGWYIDAVLQGSFYNGNASTQFARLQTNGTGFTSSLEAGYPIPLPWLGSRFVLEPESQIIWQRVSFDDASDGLGPVGLGTTSGASGRLGLRGKWTIDDAAGRVWQPYVLANVWRDWGGRATTMFGGDAVPLLEQATRLEFAGGLSAKILPGLSLYAQAGYQFAVSGTDGGKRDGVQGNFGAHYSW
ncbi:autotransporter outer membrane beta-barrel domain-containing protein [Bradyrhizobium neotropicale]|uniref:autotransporter family protein n=1 Tax=Bradyrhizobium neotropicale TaxID=1497615 RepID=UPI001AD6D7C0|nr:autotransporter outer membrane beta-barrel domain-containing protein [Bradyrhizobium neotropicale]MBO4221951.1 autotransporter outer membrane beta-barrel domain-containing protein [Bradyrhizobium neotropicale]